MTTATHRRAPIYPKANATRIFAETCGLEIGDAREYRYQPGRTGKLTIFAIGSYYFAVAQNRPTWSDLDWQPNADQFWAERCGTTIWRANMNSAA